MMYLSYNYYSVQSYPLALGSLVVSLLAITLMMRNAHYVMKIKKEKENDN